MAQLLGFGTAALKRREITLTSGQLDAVRAWLISCELAWLTCSSTTDAIALEVAASNAMTDEIYARESMWKTKLGTRAVGLNRN